LLFVHLQIVELQAKKLIPPMLVTPFLWIEGQLGVFLRDFVSMLIQDMALVRKRPSKARLLGMYSTYLSDSQ
jgi:hypothetical protein